jgi:hypothetical protein
MKELPRLLVPLLLLAGLGALAYVANPGEVPPKPPPPKEPDCPDNKCPPKKPKRTPWGDMTEAAVGGPRHADGTELMLDLPASLHQRNAGGSNGAGLCVYASARHSGHWHDDPAMRGLFDWMKRHPGGSYPEKFDRTMAQFCKEKSLPLPKYLNVENADLALLQKACAAGLMPGVTYSRSPTERYAGRTIDHMVSLVHADERWFVILDNNHPGADQYEWMSLAEAKRALPTRQGNIWAIIPLQPGPPPVPVNRRYP